MNCPKCSTKLRHVDLIAVGSSMENTETIGFISGQSCWCCGTWIDEGIVQPQRRPVIMHERCKVNEGLQIILANIKAIIRFRNIGIHYTKIIEVLDLKLSPQTLRRHLANMNIKEWGADENVKGI